MNHIFIKTKTQLDYVFQQLCYFVGSDDDLCCK